MVTDDLYDLFCDSLGSLALKPGQQLVAALGGGADSQSILDLLVRYRRQNPQYDYLAIHLDHSFHPDSADWSLAIKETVVAYDIEHIFEPIEVPVEKRQSKEAAGRETRYQRMAELTREDAVLLLGQHRNDQIETFFLQLKRGSGPKGLSAMAHIQPWIGQRRLCRPLLSVSKAQIYAYAYKRELTWIEDDTNYDTSIERNFIRHKIAPQLEQRWPHFGQSVLRATRLCAEQQQVMDELLSEKLINEQRHKNHFPLTLLNQSSDAMQRVLLRTWLQTQVRSLPSYRQLEQIRQQALAAGDDSQLHVRCHGYSVRYFQQALWCDINVPTLPDDMLITQTDIDLGEWGHLSIPAELLTGQLKLSFSLPADKLAMPGRHGRKKLIDWLKQAGIPPWLRQRRPILEVKAEFGENYLWAAGIGWLSYQPISKVDLPEPRWFSNSGDFFPQP